MSMTYGDFLERIIDDGIEAVKEDYGPDDNRREGSIQGFEDCRGKTPSELLELLRVARERADRKFIETQEDDKAGVDAYWFVQSRALEIQWVCNCVGAMLVQQGVGFDDMSLVTCRGMLKALDVLGEGMPRGYPGYHPGGEPMEGPMYRAPGG